MLEAGSDSVRVGTLGDGHNTQVTAVGFSISLGESGGRSKTGEEDGGNDGGELHFEKVDKDVCSKDVVDCRRGRL